MNQKSKILKEARAFAEKARRSAKNDVNVTLKSGHTSSLGKVVNTQEKANLFMKMLRAL